MVRILGGGIMGNGQLEEVHAERFIRKDCEWIRTACPVQGAWR
jgi:hypothetical protein